MLDYHSLLNAKISCVNGLYATSEALCIWLGIETQKGLSFTGAVVREKVLQSHSHCVGWGREEKASLRASKGWFAKIEKCMSMHSMKRTGEYLNIRSYFYLVLALTTPVIVKLKSHLSEKLSF